ncbi:Lamin Tail Domain [Natronincola peptidivorans]|uniref:Lamin Tail Domain n=1 Tax=Natronincola peptidivorans TaxID=426128 RepID=A0A1I0CQR6_9FIRM|nr:CotH kinase family protein [Natronincola peptidivorans]SET22098.1 Lamin Tail Domain [Natronincola peptidivorans]
MEKKKAYIIVGILIVAISLTLVLLPTTNPQDVLYINEIMSSNGEAIADTDGDFSDWIELYNMGDKRINLNGYYLSDDPNNLTKWSFPRVFIEPGEHFLIWASGKDKAGKNGDIHTNFSISSGGEPIVLTASNGRTVIDSVEAVLIPRNMSYGRAADGGGAWSFFDMPTPGTSNNAVEGYQSVLKPPTFSEIGGFYQENIKLNLTSEEGAIIYYTLDGSEPTFDSNRYEGPIEIQKDMVVANQPIQTIAADTGPQYPISFIQTASDELYEGWGYQRYKWYPPTGDFIKATVVRAKAFKDGSVASPIATHTYFIDEAIHHRFDLPVISITTDINNLFDYEEGIYILGQTFDQWRSQNPEARVLGNAPANYQLRGIEWEKPIHIEFYEADGTLGFSQPAGLRIHGGFTRAWAQKTLRIYARNEYDTEGTFTHEIFPGLQKAGEDGTLQQFKRLILRNSGNDWSYTMFRDALIQELVKDFRIDTQAYRPAVVYINGEYWGIHNIRERFDNHYLETNYNLDGNEVAIIDIEELESEEKALDAEHYIDILNFIKEEDITLERNYNHVKTLIDIESFIDYQITGIYIANTDWLGNNVQFWRLKTEGYQPDAPYGHDGRWRWMLFDTDYGFDFQKQGMHTHNTLEWATTDKGSDRNAPEYTFLLRSLLENEEFQHQFINRFADTMNTNFRPENVIHQIGSMQNDLQQEMQYNIKRWENFGSLQEWQGNIDVMRSFAEKRPRFMRQYIMEQFGIMKTVNFTIGIEDMNEGTVRINTITIDEETQGLENNNHWQGEYFTGIPIEVKAIPKEGYVFAGWEGRVDQTQTLYIIPWEDFILRPIFERM